MADPLTEDKVERIDRALDRQKKMVDELALSLSRPEIIAAIHRAYLSAGADIVDGDPPRGQV